jgi:site-specific DNA-methyltransferase (adenine-specific)
MSSGDGAGRADWQTPADVLEIVRRVAPIGLDPCTSNDNPTRAAVWAVAPGTAEGRWSMRVDGLSTSWTWSANTPSGELVYVNPPYGRGIEKWTARCLEEAQRGAEIIALIPARTDTIYFHRDVAPPAAQAICFWRGRVTFINPDTGAGDPAPFPSALVYYGARRYRFASVFSAAGSIWI